MIITPPPADARFGFFDNYIKLVKDTDLIQGLKDNLAGLKTLFSGLSEEQLVHRYAEGKWNLKEMAAHLIDSERSFCYRAMRVSRKDQTPIPPMDVYPFVMNSMANERSTESLLEELDIFRTATIAMFRNMPPAMLDISGPGRDAPITVRGLGYAIIGHAMHHTNIIHEKYLKAMA